MPEGLAEAIKVTVQWLFAPLLVVAVLAWLCLRIEATGAFDAICSAVRKMSVFQRFAAAAFLAVFIVFASEKTNSPPANLPPAVLPSVPPQPPRSGASGVTNLCFTGISVSSNGEAQLSLAWPTNFIPTGSVIDIFASTSLVGCAWNWIAGLSVGSGATNWTPTVDTTCLAAGTDAYPPMLFFSSAVRADPGDLRDTDGDSIPDAYEIRNGGNPYLPDYDYSSKLAVRPSGSLPTIASALAASRNYSIIELDPSFVHDVASAVHVPAHPVMICSPPGTCAVVRATQFAAFLLDTNVTSRTLFKNLYVLLDARSSYQAAFFVGGNLPWYPIAASATFEDIYVRAPNPGVEHFGWLLYTSAEEPVSLSRCTVNAAGSEWVYGVQDFGTAPLSMEDCTFVNFPSNLTGRSCGILTRSSSDAGGGAEVSVSRTVFDESFTNAIMIGRLEEGVSNVISVADCIVPRELPPVFPLEFVSGVVVTNAALSWAGFPTPESPSVTLGMGALAPLANDPATDTDGDGFCDYVEVYEKGTDPYLVDSDMDGVSDYDEDQQGTDPTNPHSFKQNLTVTVTNSAASSSTYVAWGYSEVGWETNGLAMFQSSFGTVVYTNASTLGATRIKAFCDLDGDGEYSDGTDILMIQTIPQQSMATCIFNFASVDSDGDSVSDIQELTIDHTDPYDAGNVRINLTYKYTDRDAWNGCTNLIAISETSNGWNSAEIVRMSISEFYDGYNVNLTVTGGVIYVKCLHDRNGNRELDPETEKVYVMAFRAQQNGKTETAYIGDADDDGVNDTQELVDGTDIFDAKNYRLKARMDFINLDWPGTVTNYVTVSESTDDWNFSMVVTSFVGHAAGFALNMVLTNGVAYMRCLQDIEADHEYNAMTDLLYRATLTEKNTRGRFALTIGDYDGDSIPDSIEKAEETDWRNGQSYCFSLNATVVGVFAPSNALTAIAYLGSEANVLYGPCIQSGSTLTVNFGHQSTDSRETVSFMFWDDRNANGIRDSDEPRTTCDFRVTGHEMCSTNHLELGDFDADDDGMLDAWEIRNGLSPSNAADALQDADGDGFLNLYEYVAGTDPNDADDNGEGTALYAATHGVDDRIATANYSGSKPYYLNYRPQGHGVTGELQNICFDLNSNCWLHGVDMSCLSVYDDGPRDAWRHPLTAITPRHVISARHVAPADGTRVTFQSPSGDVVVRTLIAQTLVPKVADSDLWVGLLDSPLPPCIKVAKLLPQNYRLYVGEGRKLPLVRISREKECNLHDIIYLAPTDRHQRMCCLEYSTNALRYRYMRPPWGMDSGHPLFLLFGDNLAFVCPARGYYGDNQATGYLCSYYKALIQRAIDGLSEPFGIIPMQIEDFDLTVYGTEVEQ